MASFFRVSLISSAMILSVYSGQTQSTVAECNVSAGIVEYPTSGKCSLEPDYLEIDVHEFGVCLDSPNVPTATDSFLDGNTCFPVFKNEAGSTVRVENGRSNALDGDFQKPPSGQYQYIYGVFGAERRFKTKIQFDVAKTGEAGGTGEYCATTDVFVYGDHADSSGVPISNEERTRCGDETISAQLQRKLLNDFDNDPSAPVTAEIDLNPGALYLLSADQRLLTDRMESEYLAVWVPSNDANIDDNYCGFKIKWKMSDGVRVYASSSAEFQHSGFDLDFEFLSNVSGQCQ